MAGGDAAKLENEKQKNLADQQDQSPHKDAPRWNEALAVSPLTNPASSSSTVRKRDESGRSAWRGDRRRSRVWYDEREIRDADSSKRCLSV
jgi:hypothetical protein